MGKTAVITIRIDAELKQNAGQIFRKLGLTTTEAITLFLRQVSLQRGLSFMLETPNAATARALQEAQSRQNLKSFTDTEELFTDCGIR